MTFNKSFCDKFSLKTLRQQNVKILFHQNILSNLNLINKVAKLQQRQVSLKSKKHLFSLVHRRTKAQKHQPTKHDKLLFFYAIEIFHFSSVNSAGNFYHSYQKPSTTNFPRFFSSFSVHPQTIWKSNNFFLLHLLFVAEEPFNCLYLLKCIYFLSASDNIFQV